MPRKKSHRLRPRCAERLLKTGKESVKGKDLGKIATDMAWHVRNDRDKRHEWMRQQVKSVYRNFQSGRSETHRIP